MYVYRPCSGRDSSILDRCLVCRLSSKSNCCCIKVTQCFICLIVISYIFAFAELVLNIILQRYLFDKFVLLFG